MEKFYIQRNMKKVISLIFGILIFANALDAQLVNWWKNPSYLQGVKIGITRPITVNGKITSDGVNKTGSFLLQIDSVTTDNITNPTLFKLWRNGVQQNPDVPAGSQIDLKTVVPMNTDTIPQIVFGAGDGVKGSQTSFQIGKVLGMVYWGGSDTLHIYEVRGSVVQDSGAVTSGVQIYYAPHVFEVTSPGEIFSATADITDHDASGTIITVGAGTPHLEVTSIPPGNWIWSKVVTKSNGNMPVFMNLTLSGYKQNRRY
jgi:hypothetical protein